MNKLSPLDEGLHNNLYEFEAPVSETHWDRLSSALDKKKKRPVYLRFLIPLLIAGAVGSYLTTEFVLSARKNKPKQQHNAGVNSSLAKGGNEKTAGEVKYNPANDRATNSKVGYSIKELKPFVSIKLARPTLSFSLPAKEGLITSSFSLLLAERKNLKFNYAFGSMVLPDMLLEGKKIEPLLMNKKMNRSRYEFALIPSVGFYSVNYVGMNIPSNYQPTPVGDGLVNMVSNADLQGANYGFTFYGRRFLSNRFYLSAGMGLNMSKQTIHYVITNNVKGYSIKDGFLNYTNLEIPLGAGYRLSSYASKGAFYVEPGVNIMAVRHTRANVFNLETELQENVKMNTALINPRLAFHFNHTLGEFKLNAFYQVRYSRYTTSSSYHYTIGGFQHQIGIGFSREF